MSPQELRRLNNECKNVRAQREAKEQECKRHEEAIRRCQAELQVLQGREEAYESVKRMLSIPGHAETSLPEGATQFELVIDLVRNQPGLTSAEICRLLTPLIKTRSANPRKAVITAISYLCKANKIVNIDGTFHLPRVGQ